MILLLDIGNTHTHLGLANRRRVVRHADIPTAAWRSKPAETKIRRFTGRPRLEGAAFCSVVPVHRQSILRTIKRLRLSFVELSPKTLRGVGLNCPHPEKIGPDRLANAIALRHHYGAPAVAVDFGTAVTFDVVDADGNFCGGIIAPGPAAMTDYLHEKTALLPRVELREPARWIGKSTQEAMLVAAVHGYRGMIRALIGGVRRELRAPRLPIVATGGCARLMAARMPEFSGIEPLLTLEGLRLLWLAHHPG